MKKGVNMEKSDRVEIFFIVGAIAYFILGYAIH
jgi:hypothetical protein